MIEETLARLLAQTFTFYVHCPTGTPLCTHAGQHYDIHQAYFGKAWGVYGYMCRNRFFFSARRIGLAENNAIFGFMMLLG
jgi:hypothetical protein